MQWVHSIILGHDYAPHRDSQHAFLSEQALALRRENFGVTEEDQQSLRTCLKCLFSYFHLWQLQCIGIGILVREGQFQKLKPNHNIVSKVSKVQRAEGRNLIAASSLTIPYVQGAKGMLSTHQALSPVPPFGQHPIGCSAPFAPRNVTGVSHIHNHS